MMISPGLGAPLHPILCGLTALVFPSPLNGRLPPATGPLHKGIGKALRDTICKITN